MSRNSPCFPGRIFFRRRNGDARSISQKPSQEHRRLNSSQEIKQLAVIAHARAQAGRTPLGHHGDFAPCFRAHVVGVVLAGGRGSRVGGRDKGLLRRGGRPLVAEPAALLARYSQRVLISANRHRPLYARFADRVVADTRPGYAGPLAGISAALDAVRARIVLVLPCDVGPLPADLPQRLIRALALNGTSEAAVVRDPQRCQPLVAALRGRLKDSLNHYLDEGGRSVHGWLDTVRVVQVPVPRVIGNHNFMAPWRRPD